MPQLNLLLLLTIALLLSTTIVRAQDAKTCETGVHLFGHEYLATDPVCIPDNPRRVLAMDMAALEFLYYTDREIVGSMQWILMNAFENGSVTPKAAEIASVR